MLMKKTGLRNIEQIPRMDDFMKEIFNERTKSNELQVDAPFEKY